MRWIWIDKFLEFDSGKRAVAVKNTTNAEEHLHDLFPDWPIVPQSLIIEGVAQTGGMLVGEAEKFAYKVVLAKITRATFHRIVRPGQMMIYNTTVEQINETGASIKGRVDLIETPPLEPPCELSHRLNEPTSRVHVADIDMMFSHLENNLGGRKFPEGNFVFTPRFMMLLTTYRRGLSMAL